jgi:hypothetical protein
MNPTTWAAFYDKNKNDGGAVEALFQQADDTLSTIAKSHTLEPNKLIATITGSDGANLLLIPSVKKNSLEWIHQGIAFNLKFGGDMHLAFVHGNRSSSPFKSLTIDSAVDNLGTTGSTTRQATAGYRSPKPESYFDTEDETEFTALPAEDCDILQGHPNHVFVHPSYFIHGDGPKSIRASALALAIIDQLQKQREAAPDDVGIQAEVAKEMTAVAPLLAFLWASAKGYLAQHQHQHQHQHHPTLRPHLGLLGNHDRPVHHWATETWPEPQSGQSQLADSTRTSSHEDPQTLWAGPTCPTPDTQMEGPARCASSSRSKGAAPAGAHLRTIPRAI